MELGLDNRLYVLRSSNLPDDLRSKFVEADKLFLRDQNDESEAIIIMIERECLVRDISLYQPDII